MESSKTSCFKVRTKVGVLTFRESEKGLYYYDTSSAHISSPQYAFVTTVNGQMEASTNREYHQAKLVRQIQETIGCLSLFTFLSAIDNYTFKDIPIAAML